MKPLAGVLGQALAQLPIRAAAAGARRQHLDHLVVAGRRDRHSGALDRDAAQEESGHERAGHCMQGSHRLAAKAAVALPPSHASVGVQSTFSGSPVSSTGGVTALVSTGSSVSAIDATSS